MDKQKPNEMLLSLQSVAKKRPKTNDWLFKNLTITIKKNTPTIIFGPSGTGKSLLLRCVAMLDLFDEGHVLWRGEKVEAKRVLPFRKEVLYLPQNPVFVGELVKDVLRHPFSFKQNDKKYDENLIAKLLSDLGLGPDFLTKKVSRLSGGEAQLMGLICALQMNSRLLLLDEPTSSLDHKATLRVEKVLFECFQQGPLESFALITHDELQAKRIGGDVVNLDVIERRP